MYTCQAVKRGAQRAEDKKNSGWFGGWFGGGSKKKKEEKEADKAIRKIINEPRHVISNNVAFLHV